MASLGPLEAWRPKKARMSSRRRYRVRPSWAISSNPGGTPRRIEAGQRDHCALAAAPVGVDGWLSGRTLPPEIAFSSSGRR